MPHAPILVWFQSDLRLADHRALQAALAAGAPVIPVFILDDSAAGSWVPGGASRWWLHGSLASLARDLEHRGSRLILRRGGTLAELHKLVTETGALAVHFSRRYEPAARMLEDEVKSGLDPIGVACKRFGGSLLFEPESVRSKTNDVYKVFTPFWRAACAGDTPRLAAAAPKRLPTPATWPVSDKLETWGLLPTSPDWAGGLRDGWTPGETGAQEQLTLFMADALTAYKEDRDRPDRPGTSRLSPHLHFGEISPAMIWHEIKATQTMQPRTEASAAKFLAEIGWREFSYHLLFNFPHLPETAFRADFAGFPWRDDAARLRAWQRGETGYPIVDAGMRQLRQTGWMHNRVRMVVASFLVKHLLIPWQAGEAWFWDNLVDADLASNAASWQWVAGCGADAAPYFRIFNPMTQGEKFDPDGGYVRTFVPELAKLRTDYIHAPWTAPALELAAAGIKLGKTYPHPIVDHSEARDAALAAFQSLKVAAS